MLRTFARNLLGIIVVMAVIYSCASIGRPEGGPVDETPPRFIGSTPEMNGLNVTRSKITIEFDEYIKLEKANENVVISPPQVQQAEIKTSGRAIVVNLQDTLKPNTTYTIDFADGIVDNNEGNALGNFTFTFSTGAQIDTMEVSGILLEASNLEPLKGAQIGLHANLADSAFTTLPFDRVSRTDSRGRFTIRGIAPGTYRIFALVDADQNYYFSQKSEVIAFHDSLIIPRFEERIRFDTVWRDSITVDSIVERKYTHYLPDAITLRSFLEEHNVQYFVKSERLTPEKFSLYFGGKTDTLPILKGLNFDEKDAFIIEKSRHNDTIHYWIKDSLLFKQDTLKLSMDYLYTDTLNQLSPKTDTLKLYMRKWKGSEEKKEDKKKKKGEDDDEPETEFLKVDQQISSSMDVYGHISLTFEQPIASFIPDSIHLRQKIDTLWQDVPFDFEQDTLLLRKYNLYANWTPGADYEFKVDSTAFVGLYGLHTDAIKQAFKVRSLDDYGAIYFNVSGYSEPAFVELLDAQDKVVSRAKVVNNNADFNFLNPGKYSARLIEDRNNNLVWDTGNYEGGLQPEMVYYYPQILELKAMWQLEQDWNVLALPLDKQKPDDMKKQKPDEDKKKKKNTNKR